MKGFKHAAREAKKQKKGQGIPNIYQPNLELSRMPVEEEMVYRYYPKLAKKFKSDN